ncbi:hypothetical protein PLESTF_000369800 [Pleodorina starrii]|nr:hypothetical protein PLESTF_000369800 [Pleodorina starrii]
MVLDFHGTRRSVQELHTLLGIFQSLKVNAMAQVPKSFEPVVISKNVDKDLFVINGEPQNITSLTFVFKSSSCGVAPKLNSDIVRSWWYDSGDNASVSATLQRYYNVCTYNQLTFRPENNLVFDVDIPCTGTTSIGPYDLRTGYGNGRNLDNELKGLAELGRQHLMAAMGCAADGDCYSWLNPRLEDDSLVLPIAFQELGHNIGLTHSARITCEANGKCTKDEYGDPADPMGYTWVTDPKTQLTCTNAPQSYKAGWSTPIANLNAFAELKPGSPREFSLPAMGLNKSNHLRIVTDQSNPIIDDNIKLPQRALFVSFRVAQSGPGAYDSGLLADYLSRVWVHEYNSTANGSPGALANPPLVLAMLSSDTPAPRVKDWAGTPQGTLSSVFTQLVPGLGGIAIAVKNRTDQAVTVSVCRFLRPTEDGPVTCMDGQDNDCDGLVDMADPDCNPKLRPPPPLPPAPRSPPLPRYIRPAGIMPLLMKAPVKRSPPSPPRPPRNPRPPRGPGNPHYPRAPRPPRAPRSPPARK